MEGQELLLYFYAPCVTLFVIRIPIIILILVHSQDDLFSDEDLTLKGEGPFGESHTAFQDAAPTFGQMGLAESRVVTTDL